MKGVAFAAAGILLAQQPQQPLRSGVELVRIDVQVTNKNGQPTENLRPDQFEVNIDGKTRPVVALDFVRYNAAETRSGGAGAAASTAPSGAVSEAPRVLILAVDQASFIQASRQAPIEVIKRIAAMANPRDLIGLIAFPNPGVTFSPSLDRAALLEAASKIDARLHFQLHNRLQFSLADAVDWASDPGYRQKIIDRECNVPGDMMCGREVEMMANELIGTFQMQAMMSVSGLQNAVETIKQYPGRKTMILVSAGFVASDRMNNGSPQSRTGPDVRFEADVIGRRAAEANTVIYSLHPEVGFLHAFSTPQGARQLQNVMRDTSLLGAGLERFTASAGGTVIPVPASPDKALERVLSETSTYYLLGVEPLPEHRDGKVHRITVKVKQGGTQVRARSSVLVPKSQ